MSNTEGLVKPADCRRCDGSGFIPAVMHNNMGRCYSCGGDGQGETDKAALAARKARSAARTALGHAAFNHSHAAHSGLSLLEVREPARLTKAIDAFAAGHPGVLDALAAYKG